MNAMPTRLVPSPDALARELNGEILLLDLRTIDPVDDAALVTALRALA